jgi:hypothetical protein
MISVILQVAFRLIPEFYKRRWYVALIPFFASIVSGAYYHNATHILIGAALTLPVAFVGCVLAITNKSNYC